LKAVFLDRDGVICENRPDHVKSWEDFSFVASAREATARLTGAGLPVVVITNQAAINRGLVSPATVDEINRRMVAALEAGGSRVERIYCCPHRPDELCPCRKPQPGLLLQAAADLGIELERSYLVGDAVSDIQAAQAVGATPYLVLTGRGEQQQWEAVRLGLADYQVCVDLAEAVSHILECEARAASGGVRVCEQARRTE